MAALKEYAVNIGGIRHTIQATDDEAERLNLGKPIGEVAALVEAVATQPTEPTGTDSEQAAAEAKAAAEAEAAAKAAEEKAAADAKAAQEAEAAQAKAAEEQAAAEAKAAEDAKAAAEAPTKSRGARDKARTAADK